MKKLAMIQVEVAGVSTPVCVSELTKKYDDNGVFVDYYKYYTSTMEVDYTRENDEIKKKAIEDAKKAKEESLKTLTIEHNGVVYDAHQEAINNMSSVANVASAQYNLKITQGATKEEAYNSTYKVIIPWKGATNEVHQVQIESIVEALEKSMQERAKIYGAV